MRGNELLDKMELIDPAYIESADRAPVRKRIYWTRWVAMAACFCLISVTVWLWNAEYGNPDILSQDDKTNIDSTQTAMDWTESGGIELATEPYHIPANNGPVGDEQSILNGKPMISGFGETDATVDMSVSNGGVWYSRSLEAAMDHYGDTANYRVLVELFSDGVQIASGGAQATEEAARLSELGYIVAMETSRETVTDGKIATVYVTYYFTIHATYEQLLDFQQDGTLGYKFMLYDEVLGTGQESDLTSYNGMIP